MFLAPEGSIATSIEAAIATISAVDISFQVMATTAYKLALFTSLSATTYIFNARMERRSKNSSTLIPSPESSSSTLALHGPFTCERPVGEGRPRSPQLCHITAGAQ